MLCTCIEGLNYLDVVLKLRGKLIHDKFSLVAESVGSKLAKDLGLESAEIVAAEVGEALADAARGIGDEDYARLIERSIGMNIGSILLTPGFVTTIPSETEFARLREKVAAIVAFDFTIQNLDRQNDNPNLLRKSDRIVLIDHEQAFGHLEDKDCYPFDIEKLDMNALYGHVFFQAVDLATDFSPFFYRLADLKNAAIDTYCRQLPEEWLDERTTRLSAYLRWARDNAEEIGNYLRSYTSQ